MCAIDMFLGIKRTLHISQPHASNAEEEEPHVSRWKAERSGGEWKVCQGFSNVADDPWTHRKLQLVGSPVEPLQSRSQLKTLLSSCRCQSNKHAHETDTQESFTMVAFRGKKQKNRKAFFYLINGNSIAVSFKLQNSGC